MARRKTVVSLVPDSEIEMLAASRPDVDFTKVDAQARPGPVHGDVLLVAGPSAQIESYLGPGVSWVHTLATGVEEFPLEALRGVDFTCSRGNAGPAIAEWVLAVMLAYEKRIPESWVGDAASASWFRAELGGLRGKTLGVVGVGGIGTEIVRRALAFDMHVVGVRRRMISAPFPGVTIATDLSEVLPIVDHLVLAAPATAATRHLLDTEALARLKPGAHVVNVARGALVDQEALRRALDCGRVGRASLDVATPEPLPAGHWLYTHPSVRLSPHISWSAPWQRERVLGVFLDNLDRFVAGLPLVNRVDLDAGY